ncbi:CDGP domain-containing protein [Mycobacterium talmoniae]|uniref:CDGP domain-containing protein n=1 Tax=Mycobacterium talmoniae TaxID=1858794 RepID=A0A1S1NP64_9MYCO|nr:MULTISPECIES: hypothetical protein [Mycobacterium]OHV06024.1 hypothetical protein BKN37_03460 [Mycobacterium talmoniae]PQM44959.1 hypothetical protein C1Y40_04889 [Mycobacterium talmoniae]TDH49944.1 hypothetical protein E2F47_19350 [Mycobacterium eburneum]
MSSAYRRHRIAAGAAGVIAAGAAVAALITAPASRADPGAGCENQDLGTVCDGPIRPDNTFKRCSAVGALYIGKGRFLPAREACWVVDLNTNPDFGAGLPPYHIGG